ncbi:MAG: hypothetical protein JWN34_3640, partial [Bryobacterales bacterium]|nr:hypothetical protein [Bryobacterales bacterium]
KPAAPYKGGPIHIAFTGGPGTDNPTRIAFSNATLSMVFKTAFDLQDTQKVSGPDWLNIDMFDIAAKLPPGATQSQLRTMLQNLLAERFHMAWHREKQSLPAYVLTAGKGRIRLPVSRSAASSPAHTDKSGPGFRRITCDTCTVGQFVKLLGHPDDRLVFDETNLTGVYDFALTWEPGYGICKGCTVGGTGAPSPPPPPDEAPPILSVALDQQLGLRLERQQRPVDVIVIDHIDRIPVSN